MRNTDRIVSFLYKTVPGKMILSAVMKTHADRILVRFLISKYSRPIIGIYARKHGVDISLCEKRKYRTFQEFFARQCNACSMDYCHNHLISPCDGWLSCYRLESNSVFEIKGSRYSVEDITEIENKEIVERYEGGTCLVIRLCASDCHHYCYIDDGWKEEDHFIPGELHSVQPAAFEGRQILTHNRRSWCVLETKNFGSVIQAEIGALIVGGIVNEKNAASVRRGEEMGHFELSGSTIVLLFGPERIALLPEFAAGTIEKEVRVRKGQWIGMALSHKGD